MKRERNSNIKISLYLFDKCIFEFKYQNKSKEENNINNVSNNKKKFRTIVLMVLFLIIISNNIDIDKEYLQYISSIILNIKSIISMI